MIGEMFGLEDSMVCVSACLSTSPAFATVCADVLRIVNDGAATSSQPFALLATFQSSEIHAQLLTCQCPLLCCLPSTQDFEAECKRMDMIK